MSSVSDVFFLGADPDHPELQVPIPEKARGVHSYVIGSSSVGKSKLLLDWILQTVFGGSGCAVLDPKGDLIFDILAAFSSLDEGWWPGLADRLILIDPSDPRTTATFDPLAPIRDTTPARQRADLFQTFQKIWGISEVQTPRMDLVLRRTIQLMMEHRLKIADMPRVLVDDTYRDALVAQSADASVQDFFLREFPSSAAQRFQWTSSILTRIEGFLDDPAIRAMFSGSGPGVDFREAMDHGRIVLVNLSAGRLGLQSAQLLGGFVATGLQLAAESRQHVWPPEARRRFYIACDEFHGYMVSSGLRDLLAEGRGYGVSLILAHQNLGQLDAPLQASILANAKIRACFRVSYEDAQVLSRELFTARGRIVKTRELRFFTIKRVPIPIGFNYTYYSQSEEMRHYRESLHRLPDRMFWAHLADTNTAMRLRTANVPDFDQRVARERIERFKELLSRRRGAVPREGPVIAQPPRTSALAAPLYEWAAPGRRPPRIVP